MWGPPPTVFSSIFHLPLYYHGHSRSHTDPPLLRSHHPTHQGHASSAQASRGGPQPPLSSIHMAVSCSQPNWWKRPTSCSEVQSSVKPSALLCRGLKYPIVMRGRLSAVIKKFQLRHGGRQGQAYRSKGSARSGSPPHPSPPCTGCIAAEPSGAGSAAAGDPIPSSCVAAVVDCTRGSGGG